MQNDAMATTLPRPPSTYWLLVKSEAAGRMEPLTLDLDGRGEALAVFGFEEEARMFSLWESEEEWRFMETTAWELTGMLLGPLAAGVEFVALDPLPELVSRGMAGLVSLRRERFVDRLVERAGLNGAEPLAM